MEASLTEDHVRVLWPEKDAARCSCFLLLIQFRLSFILLVSFLWSFFSLPFPIIAYCPWSLPGSARQWQNVFNHSNSSLSLATSYTIIVMPSPKPAPTIPAANPAPAPIHPPTTPPTIVPATGTTDPTSLPPSMELLPANPIFQVHPVAPLPTNPLRHIAHYNDIHNQNLNIHTVNYIHMRSHVVLFVYEYN